MDFGIGLMGYHGCWEDAAYAEANGFASAGFVDSPLLGGDPFVCMGLAADRTSTIRLGTFLAVPSNRNAATTAHAIATVNRMAPGRTFLGLATGYTSRNVFGRGPLSAERLRAYAEQCRGLLDGEEVIDGTGAAARPIRFRQDEGTYIDIEHRIPVYVAADGPKALAAVGQSADGWVTTLQYSSLMDNAEDVFAGSLASIRASATAAGRTFGDDAYTMLSGAICVLDEGESPTSERALEWTGPCAMLAFHSYADNPAIGPYLPPAFQERLPVYEREVLARFDVPEDRRHQETHRGHLTHLLPGEAEVLTDDIMRAGTMTGTAEELAAKYRALEAAGLKSVTLFVPPHLARDVVDAVAQKIMPLL